MSAREKVALIFNEMAGEHAARLDASRYLADVNSRITSAITKGMSGEDIVKRDEIGFHLVDWQADAAFIVALSLFPDRFTDDEIKEGITEFLIHAPSHVVRAADLSGHAYDTFKDEE